MKLESAAFTVRPLTEEREWEAEGIPVLRAAVSLPIPEEERGPWRRIGRYYRLQSRAFLGWCQGELYPWAAAEARAALENSVPVRCREAALTFETAYRAGQLWSLYTQARDNAGPGAASIRRWGDTWDLRTGYPVPLSAFFPARQPWRKQILARVESEMARRERHGIAAWHPDWKRLSRRYFNPRGYWLTEEGIMIFYPMYALAPAVEGVPAFLYPWEGDAPLKPVR